MAQSARATLPLPQHCPSFAAGHAVAGDRVGELLRKGTQAVLFKLQNGNILRVYYAGETPVRALRRKLAEGPVEGVCPILKMGRAGGHEYDVVPELRPLPDLQPLPEAERKEWITKQVKALQAFHRLGYVHLDVKPEHFMQDRGKRVFLIDFGSARKKNAGAGSDAPKTTPGFAPPERAAGICEASYDWYSFGMCLADQLGGGVYPGVEREAIPAVLTYDLPPTKKALPIRYSQIVRALLRVDRASRANGEDILRVLNGESEIPAISSPGSREEESPAATIPRLVPARRPQPTTPMHPYANETLAQLQERLRKLVADRAKHADSVVFARQVSSMQVRWHDRASVEWAVTALERMPREAGVVNETNITKAAAEHIFGGNVLTDFSDARFRGKTFGQRLKLMREGQDYYAASKAWIAAEQSHREAVAANRWKQAKRVLAALGIIAGIAFGIYVFIMMLPFLLLFALIVAVIASFS